ncbi:hypothetical protein KRE40_00525 [Elizabethkingia meningoseptica]|uniref:Lipoprotein n=1 Tax=Elizabethkingia meningoseptica TaxID=238 RepID=A0A1V3U030_ELIME|nr:MULTISPECIES: hypothetical protein [Elizabethkingia]AQX05671.1 hypothetical protein BBD33_10620 [Elizabethkingia meningoseptica]AQX13219.1 hypothetical protein BBD35_12935 [Elizabethkingia meningoseptica]AQX47714.1 hypothetical protein B5G46_10610 [Elizabethkingia meningoseptica]EJK5328938.1 hypothetical protein [Elizabethkingia meningoseptica]EOR30661.1 hypothetical protein L100_05056 [Elizabethkingia meningoseptica ATCC 13253 = NBRC 12535]
MKKNGIKKFILGLALVLSTGAFLTNCKSSNDDPGDPSGSIDPVVGTFKGTIEDGDLKYYNAIITITKVDNSRVKVAPKSGEAYSGYSAKTIKVTNPVGPSIVGDDEQGSIAYLIDTKSITVSTKKITPQDNEYLFTGSKQ